MTDDRQQIEELGERYAEAYVKSDLDAYTSCFDDDIIMMLTDRPAVVGLENLREHQRQFFSRFKGVLEPRTEEIEIRDDLAFVRGSLVLTLTPADGGQAITARMSWVNIDRKGADGAWRIWRSIYNYDEPVSL